MTTTASQTFNESRGEGQNATFVPDSVTEVAELARNLYLSAHGMGASLMWPQEPRQALEPYFRMAESVLFAYDKKPAGGGW